MENCYIPKNKRIEPGLFINHSELQESFLIHIKTL